jgi:ADP-ribosyl-[dinitrogen reductase] hydrolase
MKGQVPPPSPDRQDRLAGCVLGTAVGDALGLPREGLSPGRAHRMFGPDLSHALVLGRGMVSDDTEHTCMVAQALLSARNDPDRFARTLGWKLRLWILALPAGVGLGTARSIGKLWLGWPPSSSGVMSAGNGPAMRAAILGACLGTEPERLRKWVRTSTRCTHTDPRAERAAFLVAYAAAHASTRGPCDVNPQAFLTASAAALGEIDDELRSILVALAVHLAEGASVGKFAHYLGLSRGVSGYAYHTVPVALYGWLRHPGDFRSAVTEVIRAGGDSDTTGAIVGGLAGAGIGLAGIPPDWLRGLLEWPRSVPWMGALAERLAMRFPSPSSPGTEQGELPLVWPGILPRNLLLLTLVVSHGFRRLLPPYSREASAHSGVRTEP